MPGSRLQQTKLQEKHKCLALSDACLPSCFTLELCALCLSWTVGSARCSILIRGIATNWWVASGHRAHHISLDRLVARSLAGSCHLTCHGTYGENPLKKATKDAQGSTAEEDAVAIYPAGRAFRFWCARAQVRSQILFLHVHRSSKRSRLDCEPGLFDMARNTIRDPLDEPRSTR
jgi:hypothetical protein